MNAHTTSHEFLKRLGATRKVHIIQEDRPGHLIADKAYDSTAIREANPCTGMIGIEARPLTWWGRIWFFAVLAILCTALDPPAVANDIALIGAQIYTAPDIDPIANGTILISDGLIKSVGPYVDIAIPGGTAVRDLNGMVVTAGLWNTHVHFNLRSLDMVSQAGLKAYVREMLLQYGFIHVLDTGSVPTVTAEIRRRVEAGEMVGPTIVMAGGSFVPQGAGPFYLRPTVLPDVPHVHP